MLKVILLDGKNKLKKIIDIKLGNSRQINITPTEILQEVIKEQANKFILVHNHPSGDVTPSKEDIEFTKRMKICAKLLEVILLDHIIIGSEKYKSIFS